jgi:hypothetical protein
MKTKEKLKLNCLHCDSIHYKLDCQTKKGRGKFCSKECANKHRQNGSTLKCEFCEVEFYRRFGEQKEFIKNYCSKECYSNDRVLKSKKTTYLKTNDRHTHIVVAEKAMNRKLIKGEVVHHIDCNKHNNSIENLAVLPSQSIHAKVHFGNYDFEQYKLINLIK